LDLEQIAGRGNVQKIKVRKHKTPVIERPIEEIQTGVVRTTTASKKEQMYKLQNFRGGDKGRAG